MNSERRLYRPGDKVPTTGHYFPNTAPRPVARLHTGAQGDSQFQVHYRINDRKRLFHAGDNFTIPDGFHDDPGWFWFHE